MQKAAFSSLMLLGVILCNCDKDDPGNYPLCRSDRDWDSTSISRELIGTWQWKAEHYAMNNSTNTDKFAGLTVEFAPDHTVTVGAGEDTTDQANWSVKYEWENTYSLQLDQTTSLLYSGAILYFCEDRLALSIAHLDGPVQEFTRFDQDE